MAQFSNHDNLEQPQQEPTQTQSQTFITLDRSQSNNQNPPPRMDSRPLLYLDIGVLPDDDYEEQATYRLLRSGSRTRVIINSNNVQANEAVNMRSLPASKSAVEALPEVKMEENNSNGLCCVICNEDFEVGYAMKQLPCSHFYHGDCIIPWLKIKNTCPLCRYELPTDDEEYERMRKRRRSGEGSSAPNRDGGPNRGGGSAPNRGSASGSP